MHKVEAIHRVKVCREDLQSSLVRLMLSQDYLPHALQLQTSKAMTHLTLAIEHLTVDANIETLLETSIEELERRHHD